MRTGVLSAQFDLSGRNALVTGSSQGIGKSIALGLAEYGANVMVHYHSEHDMAEEVAREIQSLGVKSGIVSADLAKPKSSEEIWQTCIDQLGNVDILVQNVSVQCRNSWENVTYEEYRWQTDVNLGSTLWLMQQFIPAMKEKKWGRVITIGSVQQNRPHPDMIIYSATKMAMVNMVKSLAPGLGEYGITINNLAPGVILTGRNEKPLADENYAKLVKDKIPLKYFGSPMDCAGLAVLLSSEAGRYITGTDLLVDGGMSLP